MTFNHFVFKAKFGQHMNFACTCTVNSNYLLNKFWVHILNIEDLLCLLLRYTCTCNKSLHHLTDIVKCPNNKSSHRLLHNLYTVCNVCLQHGSCLQPLAQRHFCERHYFLKFRLFRDKNITSLIK